MPKRRHLVSFLYSAYGNRGIGRINPRLFKEYSLVPLQVDAFRGRSVSLLIRNAHCGVSPGRAIPAGVSTFRYTEQNLKINGDYK